MKNVIYPENEIVEFSTKSKILHCIILIPLIIVATILALFPSTFARGDNAYGTYILSPIGVLLVLGFSYSLVSALKSKVIFYKDRAVQIGVFKIRTVPYNNILGYRINKFSRVNLSKPEITMSLISSRENGSKHSRWINIDLKRSKISKKLFNFIQEEFAELDRNEE